MGTVMLMKQLGLMKQKQLGEGKRGQVKCAVEVTRPVTVPDVWMADMEKIIAMEIALGEAESAKKRVTKTNSSWIGSITIPISNVRTGASPHCIEMQNWRELLRQGDVSAPTPIHKLRIQKELHFV